MAVQISKVNTDSESVLLLITGIILITYLAGLMNIFLNILSISVLIFDMIFGVNVLEVCFTGLLSGLICSFKSVTGTEEDFQFREIPLHTKQMVL